MGKLSKWAKFRQQLAKVLCAAMIGTLAPGLAVERAEAAVVPLQLANPGFEQGLDDWVQIAGKSSMVSSVTTVVYGGTKSVRIVDDAANASAVLESGKLNATEGSSYTATARFYQTGRTAGYAKLWLVYYDEQNNPLTPVAEASASATNNSWQQLTISGVAPAGAQYVGVRVGTTSTYVSTAAYYDDITLSVEIDEEAIVAGDKQALEIGYASGDDAASVKQALSLPVMGAGGSLISWQSSHPDVISPAGLVTRPVQANGDQAVTLTATLQYGSQTDTKEFEVVVKRYMEALSNPGFETGDLQGWFQQSGKPADLSFNQSQVEHGAYSLKFNDASNSQAVGVESEKLDAVEGIHYTASAQAYIESGSASIYMRFYTAEGERIDQVSAASSVKNKWTELTVAAVAPAGTRSISVVLFSGSTNVGVSYYDSVYLGEPLPEPQGITNVELPLVNAGFESGMSGWQIKNGSQSSVSADQTRAYSGASSLLIADMGAGQAFTIEGMRELAAEQVTYTAAAKAYQLDRTGSRAYFYLYFYDEGHNLLQSPSAIGPSTNSAGNNWSDLSVEAVSPVGTRYVSVGINTTSTYTGRFWVDDIQLTIHTDASAGPLTDLEAVAADAAALSIGYIGGDHAASVTGNLGFSAVGPNQTVLLWTSDRPDIVSRGGKVMRQAADEPVLLTAEIIRGQQRTTRTFPLLVKGRPAQQPTAGEHIGNGSFEQGLTDWEQILGPLEAVAADTAGHQGKAARISHDGTSGVVLQSSPVLAEKQMEYTADAWLNVLTGNATVELRFYDAEDHILMVKPVIQGATGGWKRIGLRSVAPERTHHLRIAIIAQAGAASDFLADEVQVSGGDLVQGNRGFEAGMLNWRSEAGDGTIALDSNLSYKGDASLKLGLTSGVAPIVESAPHYAVQGERFAAFSKVYIDSGTARLSLQFYDDAGQLLQAYSEELDMPIMGWTELGVKGTAPAGSARASLAVSVGAGSLVRFDEAYVTKEFTYLGVPIKLEYIQSAVYGKSVDGKDIAYSIVADATGENTNFVGVDLETSELAVRIPLHTSLGAFTLLAASDGNVYVGSYTEGKVYKYVPGATGLIDLGIAVTGQSSLFGLTDGGNGVIYGGTYDSAYVFKYEPGVGFSTIGPNGAGRRFDEQEAYVRGMSIDPQNNVLYVGIGSHAKLIRYELDTGDWQSLLPPEYEDSTFVYHVKYTGGKVFATITPNSQVLVMSVDKAGDGTVTASVDAVLPDTYIVSDEVDGKVYYVSSDQKLRVYDLTSRTSAVVLANGAPVVTGVTTVMLPVVTMNNQQQYPGKSIVGMGAIYKGKTGTFIYNIQTNTLHSGPADLPTTNYNPRSMMLGPDGGIYTSNHLGGGTSVYYPLGSKTMMYEGLGQAENGVALDGKLYFGTYTHAKIMEYDPSKPWDFHVGGSNPRQVFELNNVYKQDRPFGAASGDGLLFIGTVPDYGVLGGALAIYNPKSGGNLHVEPNIVDKQSVVSLAYKDGILYGGTSVWGGLGVEPTEPSAKFFAYDVATRTKLFETEIAAGKRVITSVEVGPDGNIWGMCEGYIFIYDPATGNIIYNENLFPELNYAAKTSPVLYGGQLIAGDDGYMYGNTTGKFFRIHPQTRQVDILRVSTSFFIEKDDVGNIYYADTSGVWRYAYMETAGMTDSGIRNAKARADLENLSIGYAAGDHALQVKSNLTLPTAGPNGSPIVWQSGKPERIATNGMVVRPTAGAQDAEVRLTAVATNGDQSYKRTYTLKVIALPEEVDPGEPGGGPGGPEEQEEPSDTEGPSNLSEPQGSGSETKPAQMKPIVATEGTVTADDLAAALAESPTVTVEFSGATLELPLSGLAAAQGQSGRLTATSPVASYELLLATVQLLREQYGEALAELKLRITMDKLDAGAATGTGTAAAVERNVEQLGGRQLADTYAFKTELVNKQGEIVQVRLGTDAGAGAGGTRGIGSYIVPLRSAADAKRTTGAIYLPDQNRLVFAPTFYEEIDGKPVARILSADGQWVTVIASDITFADMSDHWAQADVELLANKLLVQGTGEQQYAPNQHVKRSEFAALLVRALGLHDQPASARQFVDISADAWYTGAVDAAAEAGLIEGYDDGTFRPDEQITREQQAAMIVRAMAYIGMQTSSELSGEDRTAALAAFADADQIGWAQDELAVAVKKGLMQGTAERVLNPQGYATRAEMAVMMGRLLAKIGWI